MRKLRRAAKPAVGGIKHSERRANNRLDHVWRELATLSRERLGMSQRTFDQLRLLQNISVLFAKGIGNGNQHAFETWAAVVIVRREVCPAIKRLAVGREKR